MPNIPRVRFFWAFHNYNAVMYDSKDHDGYHEFKRLTGANVPILTYPSLPVEHTVYVSKEGARLVELCLNKTDAYALIKAWIVRHQ